MKLKSLLPSIGLAGALAFAPDVSGASRGIRNNNPGNIVKSSIQWKGAVGNDGSFVKFASPEDGIRAMAKIIRVYESKYNLTTIRQIISRWAPPTENQTEKYIDFVSKKMNKKPDEKLNLQLNSELATLLSAIIQFENGSVPYSKETIIKGIEKL